MEAIASRVRAFRDVAKMGARAQHSTEELGGHGRDGLRTMLGRVHYSLDLTT